MTEPNSRARSDRGEGRRLVAFKTRDRNLPLLLGRASRDKDFLPQGVSATV
jgi:hypothetical protein